MTTMDLLTDPTVATLIGAALFVLFVVVNEVRIEMARRASRKRYWRQIVEASHQRDRQASARLRAVK